MSMKIKNQSPPSVAVLLIGNELLSGQVQDQNLAYIGKKLEEQGIQVSEAQVVPDTQDNIVNSVNFLRHQYDFLITTGGIGPTHDDITAEAIAVAFNVPLQKNPEAVACFVERENMPLTDAQDKMSLLPQGASIVKNVASKAPGFRMDNVFVLAGFPHIMKCMFEDVLQQLGQSDPIYTEQVLFQGSEGKIAILLGKIQKDYPSVQIGSYPYYREDAYGTTLIFKGRNQTSVQNACQAFNIGLKKII